MQKVVFRIRYGNEVGNLHLYENENFLSGTRVCFQFPRPNHLLKWAVLVPKSAFVVDVQDSDTIGHLQQTIHKMRPNSLGHVDADQLRIFPAKRDGNWLSATSLKNGNVALVQDLLEDDDLSPSDVISHVFRDLGKDVVHVLVVDTTCPLPDPLPRILGKRKGTS